MKRLFFAAVLCAASLLAAPAYAAELPSFCTKPTVEEQADTELQKACDDLKEIDKAMETLRQGMTRMEELLTKIEQLNSKLERDVRTIVPMPRPRPKALDNIPSHPSEVQRQK